ncbi:MAG: DUF5060 domain-containing protein [Nitrospinota bacterium]
MVSRVTVPGLVGLFLMLVPIGPASGVVQVGLYDVFETQITNSKTYSNPFDYNVIGLKTSFTAPSGKSRGFFGFYDGDGAGGQTGNTWKARFMPDETGTWTFSYSWTDGTPGGSGTFEVIDTGLPGPLKIASDNPWFFMDSRGDPFHFRGYDTHVIARTANTNSFLTELPYIKQVLQTHLIDDGYNFTMWDGLINRKQINDSNVWDESWWLNTTDTKVFNIAVWMAFEELLHLTKDNHIFVVNFAGMIYQGHHYNINDFKVFLHYWVARFAPFYNYFGWSPTWEWGDIWSTADVNAIMQFVYDLDPWKHLQSAHDHSNNAFSGWLGFSMRQQQSRTVFKGNVHGGGKQGGVGSAFLNMPILGSEDIWELWGGGYGQPRNATEVRRGGWGIMMAGVLPLYSDWHPNPLPAGGGGTGEAEIRRMFDFFYTKTNYRQYQQLNNLVSASNRQICSGIAGEEYLVYDENGGAITINLWAAAGTDTFSVLWYDPSTGAEQAGGEILGGEARTLTSPYAADSVLFLTKSGSGAPDTTPPSVTSVSADGNNGEVKVGFSEKIDGISATTLANYSIAGGVTVSGASLSSDQKTVTLSSGPYTKGSSYTLTVANITDVSSPPNMMSVQTIPYTPSFGLNVTLVSPLTYVTGVLQAGDEYYTDRTYTITSLPAEYSGLTWIKTANNDKSQTSETFLSFTLSEAAFVYVLFDSRATSLPNWLSSFVNTGTSVQTSSLVHDVYKKQFSPGAVVLGGNSAAGSVGANSNYVVMVQAAGEVDTLAPGVPPDISVQ